MRVFHKDAKSANKVLSEGASIFNKRTIPKKPKKEPIRCLHCQRFGHERRDCKSDLPNCGRCAGAHETNDCTTNLPFKCVNCNYQHPSYDRECSKFREKCRQTDSRCPENKLAFYPTSEPWTWVTNEQLAHAEPPSLPPSFPPPFPQPGPEHRPPRQTRLTGANSTPMGRPSGNNQQSHPPARS